MEEAKEAQGTSRSKEDGSAGVSSADNSTQEKWTKSKSSPPSKIPVRTSPHSHSQTGTPKKRSVSPRIPRLTLSRASPPQLSSPTSQLSGSNNKSLPVVGSEWQAEREFYEDQMSALKKRVMEVEESKRELKSELDGAQDQNELLEFRVLELEETLKEIQEKEGGQSLQPNSSQIQSTARIEGSPTLQLSVPKEQLGVRNIPEVKQLLDQLTESEAISKLKGSKEALKQQLLSMEDEAQLLEKQLLVQKEEKQALTAKLFELEKVQQKPSPQNENGRGKHYSTDEDHSGVIEEQSTGSLRRDGHHSSFMETETDRTSSELQVESQLWEEIEGAKSSTDTQLNFLQDQSDQDGEHSIVEELFQAVEKGTDRSTASGDAVEMLPRKPEAGEGDEESDVLSDDDTGSSFSLPLPDDEEDGDMPAASASKRKLSAEMFNDLKVGIVPGVLEDLAPPMEPISDIPATQSASLHDEQNKEHGERRESFDKREESKVKGNMYGDASSDENSDEKPSDDDDDDDDDDDEAPQIPSSKPPPIVSTEKKVISVDSDVFPDDDDDIDDDTQTDISELISQNEELKEQCRRKDEEIEDMKATSRIMKQVIKDQMSEFEKMREVEVDNSLQDSLSEYQMKEDTLKRVVKDLQTSEQSLKEQLNQLTEKNDEVNLELQLCRQQLSRIDQEDIDSTALASKCDAAEQKVKELEQLNVQILEKYEMEIAEKDARIKVLREESSQLKDFRSVNESLQQDLEGAKQKLLQNDETITSLEETVAMLENKVVQEKESRQSEDQLKSKVKELEVGLEETQTHLARKHTEIVQLKAQVQLVQDENDNKWTEEVDAYKKKLKLLEEETIKLQAQMEQQEQLKTAQDSLTEMQSSLEKQISAKIAELAKLQGQLVVMTEKYETEHNEKEQIIQENKNLKEELENKELHLHSQSSDVEKLKQQLGDNVTLVMDLRNQVQLLESEKAQLEEKMAGIEDLLKDSVIDNEDMLRSRIVELEMIEKTLTRKLQETESSNKQLSARLEDTVTEMRETELSYEEKFDELRSTEQKLMEKVADLEEGRGLLLSEAEMQKERADSLESLNQRLKEKLQEVETELEELQVVSKLAGDDMGNTQHSLPSLLDEGLGALDTGRTGASHVDNYSDDDYGEDDEDFVLSDDLPQNTTKTATINEEEETSTLRDRITQLEKSEQELMEKAEFLQQSEAELSELLESTKADKDKVITKYVQELDNANQAIQELQEQVALLDIEKDELTLKLEELAAREDPKNEEGKDMELGALQEKLQQHKAELKSAQEIKVDLETKLKSLEQSNSDLQEKLKELNVVKTKLEEANMQISVVDAKNNELQKKLEEYELVNEELLTKCAESEARAGNTDPLFTPESLSDLEQENLRIMDLLRQAEEEQSTFKEQMKAMEKEIEFLEEQKVGGEQSIAELSFQVESLQDEFACKAKLLAEHEGIMEEKKMELLEMKKTLDEKEEALQEMQAMNKRTEDDCVLKSKMLSENANTIEKLTMELDETKKNLASLDDTCNELRSRVRDLEKTEEDMLRRIGTAGEQAQIEEQIVAKEVGGTYMMAPPQYATAGEKEKSDGFGKSRFGDDEEESDDDIERAETTPTIEALQLRIQHLLDNEEKLQEKISELEQRQLAFNETLAQADSIMMKRESGLTQEIDELQSSNSDLRQKLQVAKSEEARLKRRLSDLDPSKVEEDDSIFDCLDEEDDDADYQGIEDVPDEEKVGELGTYRKNFQEGKRKDSAKDDASSKSHHSVAADALTQSQEKIADLMIKVDELEKQNADLRQSLEEQHSTMQRAVDNAQRESKDKAKEIETLTEKVTQLQSLEDQLQEFLEEKDSSEYERPEAESSKQASDSEGDVHSLKKKIADLERVQEELREELRETKESEETATEISEEQNQEIERLKDELVKTRSKKQEPSDRKDSAELEDVQAQLSSALAKNQEQLTEMKLLANEVNELKEGKDKLEEDVNVLNALVEELERSQQELSQELREKEQAGRDLAESNEQMSRTTKTLEESIEMLTSRLQESEMGQDGAMASNKILEGKFKDMLVSEAALKEKLKRAGDAEAALKDKVSFLQKADEEWRQEVQKMEEAVAEAKRQSRRAEEELKLTNLDNGQLKHENEMLTEKLDSLKSREQVTQNRMSEMEIGESNFRLQMKNAEKRELKLQEQVKELEGEVSIMKEKASRVNQLQLDLDSTQADLQAAIRNAEDLERSKVKLEERLQQLQGDLKSHGMVSLTIAEYQELKAQATLAALTYGDTPGGGRESGAAGEVWMRLDQKNKELREVQELYNQSVRENVRLKQTLRDQQVHPFQTGGQSKAGTGFQNVSAAKPCDSKSIQTSPLRMLGRGALQTKVMAGGEEVTLEDFLSSVTAPASYTSSLSHAPIIQTPEGLLQADLPSSGRFISEEAIEEEEDVETMATRPALDDKFDLGGLQLAVDEIDRLQVGSSMSDDLDFSLSSEPPPLPESAPPGQQQKTGRRRTTSTSSDISDLAPAPPLPSLPPPVAHGNEMDEEDGFEGPLSGEPYLQSFVQHPQLSAPTSSTEPELTASHSQDTHMGPAELRLPTIPGSRGPPVPPKPGTPLWLKKMLDWQNGEKEKEHGELGRLKTKVLELTKTTNHQEEELRQLRVERDQMKRQLQGASDARELQHKLQSRDLELEEKERQVTRLKTEMKEKEMELVRLKSQLEALSHADKTSSSEEMIKWRLKDQLERSQEKLREKEQLIHSHDAQLGRLKADLLKKENELMSKESSLQLATDQLEALRQRMRLREEGQLVEEQGKLQAAEVSTQLASLKAENERLQSRVSELEPLERHVGELKTELRRTSFSARGQDAIERKLQQAQKMLQEKTKNELRLEEDNACLQERLNTINTEDAYTKELEQDLRKMEEQVETLEHERNEAELAVAPLKAKVSYLTNKCQERDKLIRKLKQEIGRIRSDRSADLLDEIGQLSTLLPEEAYNEPLKTFHKPTSGTSRHRRSRKHAAETLDLSDLLDENEKEFLKRESHGSDNRLLDSSPTGEEISIEELLRKTSHRRGIGSSLDDITVDDLDVMETREELNGDHFSALNGIGLGIPGRKTQSPVSIGFTASHKGRSRLAKSQSVAPDLASLLDTQSSPQSEGLDHVDGSALPHAPLPVPLPAAPPTQPSLLMPNLPAMPPPLSTATLQHPPPHHPSTDTNGLGLPVPRPPEMGVNSVGYTHSAYPPLNNAGYQPLGGPTAAPLGNLGQHTVSNVLSSAAGVAPSTVGVLPLSHQNVLNLAGNQAVNGHLGRAVLQPGHAALNGMGGGIPDPPRSLSVARVVSKHSVLLTWTPPSMDILSRSNGSEVVGYRIYVNDQQKQVVSSAHMTKALVDGIYVKSVHKFGMCSVTVNGVTSSMTELVFNQTSSIPSSTPSESGKSESAPDASSDVSSTGARNQKERLFMAVYSYDPEHHSPNDNPDYELAFTEGDLITVYGPRRADGFYHGKIKGRKGLVPSNFIEEISESDSRKLRAAKDPAPKRSRDHHRDNKRKKDHRGRGEREGRRREGQSHRGPRV
ncbi:uncharacterized protein [Diadema setosum]|uniref:uncharacterized protein n=1 Tax=Diadema setosum TaxID=31175 RepID=UPI003B3A7B39